MIVSYGKLWANLHEKHMKKTDLKNVAKIGWTTVSKLTNGEEVSMRVLLKICETLDLKIEDIVEFKKVSIDNNEKFNKRCK